jgi:hypothetical protein
VAIKEMSCLFKPDLNVFHKLILVGLQDVFLDSEPDLGRLLAFARDYAQKLPSSFLSAVGEHAVARISETHRLPERDSNLCFLLSHLSKPDLRIFLLRTSYEQGWPGPDVLQKCTDEEQRYFCKRLEKAPRNALAFLSADVFGALTPKNTSVALGAFFSSLEDGVVEDLPTDEVVAILEKHGCKRMWSDKMREYVLSPPKSDVDHHTTVSVRFLQKHWAALKPYERWMLTSKAPLRVVVELVRRDGVHVEGADAKGLVHRTLDAVSGPQITRAKYNCLAAIYHGSPLRRLFLELLQSSDRLTPSSKDKIVAEMSALDRLPLVVLSNR